jgi:hypothetical protein
MGKQPDLLYEDKPAGKALVFEVKRLWDKQTQENVFQWKQFLRSVECHMPKIVPGYFLVTVNLSDHPPRDRTACIAKAFAKALTERSGVSEEVETINLNDIVPDTSVHHYTFGEPEGRIALYPPIHQVDLSFGWYRELLQKTNEKFRDYNSVHEETFLLIDSRTLDAIWPNYLSDFRTWHQIARDWKQPYALTDLRPFAFTLNDFSNIHHVIEFGFDPDLYAKSIWQAPNSVFRTPDEWTIEDLQGD